MNNKQIMKWMRNLRNDLSVIIKEEDLVRSMIKQESIEDRLDRVNFKIDSNYRDLYNTISYYNPTPKDKYKELKRHLIKFKILKS